MDPIPSDTARNNYRCYCEICDGPMDFHPAMVGEKIDCLHCGEKTKLGTLTQPRKTAGQAKPVVTSFHAGPHRKRVKRFRFLGPCIMALGAIHVLFGLFGLITAFLPDAGFIPGIPLYIAFSFAASFIITLIGLCLFEIGRWIAYKLICSKCGNQLSGLEVALCPVCHVEFPSAK